MDSMIDMSPPESADHGPLQQRSREARSAAEWLMRGRWGSVGFL